MNPVLQHGLLKALYGAAGVFVGAFIPFLNANPTALGGFTAAVVVILTVVEETYWPSAPSSPSA